MTDGDERHAHLRAAASPRRARANDAPQLARLLAAAFASDPVMDWVVRRGAKRAASLERFFYWLITVRAIPFGEVWLAETGGATAVWLPPDVPATAGGFAEQMRLLPMFLRLCGIPRFLRGQAIADAMEKHHPHEPHYYLAFLAVAPRLQGLGLGSALLDATLSRIDGKGAPAYLENSNPRNTRLYERAGFVRRRNIAPKGAPPLIAMWRERRTRIASSQ